MPVAETLHTLIIREDGAKQLGNSFTDICAFKDWETTTELQKSLLKLVCWREFIIPVYGSTSIQNVHIKQQAKPRLLATHSCLHSSLGLFTLKKEPHRGFIWMCIQERHHLWGPDPPAEGRKLGIGAAGNYTRLDPTAAEVVFSLKQKTGTAPPGKILPSRGCSVLSSRRNAILHVLLPSHLFQTYLFSSLASCCCLML